MSQQRYAPYGEVRWSSGAGMPTDFTFTSQRAGPAGYVGSLMDYNARFFSPALGRFISADTIVPGAGNPQAFNRYAYALDNPLKFVDPSGHLSCPTSESTGCQDYMKDINAWGMTLSSYVKKGLLGAVEAIARLADFSWNLADKDVHTFIWGMTQLLNGWDIHVSDYASDNIRNRISETGVGRFLRINRVDTPVTQYFLGPEAFAYEDREGLNGLSDWSAQYYEGTKGQAYHFWAYVAISEKNGRIPATKAVEEHDPPSSPRSYGVSIGGGVSFEDYALGVAAVEFHEHQSAKSLCIASLCLGSSPGSPGDWIREKLQSK